MPNLLQWCILEPSEQGNMAAIRFSAPVRVQSIRIFPTGAKPFLQCPDTVGRTEPQAFFLDIFFNAHPVSSIDAKEKPKPSNALVPTSVAYSGGMRDFAVNMGPEYATRLMIIKGAFESVSMAIYGELVADKPEPSSTYEPRPLASTSPIHLVPALDPANERDPTQLARQLLKLIPEAPDLELVIRLVFCLKPSNDDWDLPEFPYLHPDLDEEIPEFDLEKASRLTVRPVPDDIPSETIIRFAQKVARCISATEKDASQAYLVACLLCHAACQHPSVATSLLDVLNLQSVFDLSTLEDETTLLKLLYASANADIAKSLSSDWFQELLSSVSDDPNNERETRSAARQLSARIRGWTTLQDAFSNTRGDFLSAARMLRDVGSEEQSFGNWLESMITHRDIASGLAENPVLHVALPHLLSNWQVDTSASQDEFVAFVRAFIGVACVLAVYSWSDSLPHETCRARTLAVLRLWQGVDGYREIVNHLLLLRQMTFRLECMTDNEAPTQSGIDAEHILVSLTRNPHAFLRPNLVKCVLNIGTSTSYITADERASMRQAAFVVDDGFAGAVDELLRPLERPPTFGSLRTLRVALAYLNRELDEDEDSRMLDDFWEEANCSFLTALCELLTPVTEEIRSQFSLQQPPVRRNQDVTAQLFSTADDILQSLLRLVPSHPLPSRVLRGLTTDTADLFACADAADMLYSESSQPSVAAQKAEQSCIALVRSLAEQDNATKPAAPLVLRVLLEQGLHSDGVDPTHHLLQVFCLLDNLLPAQYCMEAQRTLWVQGVIPTMLPTLWAFCHALDTENKVHFVRRLVDLDQGAIGVGEWLLLEELKDVSQAVRSLSHDESLSEPRRRVAQSQIALFFRFLSELLQGSSAAWAIESLAAEEAIHLLASSIMILLNLQLSPPHFGEVAESIASSYEHFDNELRLALVFAMWRSLQAPELTAGRLERRMEHSVTILATITRSYLDPVKVTNEIGRLLSDLAHHPVSFGTEVAHSLVSLLEWMTQTATTIPRMGSLYAISPDQFATLRSRFEPTLSADWIERLQTASCDIVFGGGNSDSVPGHKSTVLSDAVELSIHDLEDLLREHTPTPSTPPRRVLNQDLFGIVTVSPPTLLRSPAATGLTKTYQNNDFRQLRVTSARANTSRLPSMHVDEFESASQASPTLDPLIVPGVNLPAGIPFPGVPESFPQLGPAFMISPEM